ncbi:MAG: hypothetical protein Q8M22_05180, partial [Actinomycetota bacterium]|nr:hypothetical protein [Actinomycetota bacterium]
MTVAFGATALLVVAAAWASGQLLVARAATPPTQRARRVPPPTAELWAAFLDLVSAEVRTGSSLAAAVRHAVARCSPQGAVIC